MFLYYAYIQIVHSSRVDKNINVIFDVCMFGDHDDKSELT